MRLIDSHAHFPYNEPVTASTDRVKDSRLEAERKKWKKAWGFPNVEPIDDFDTLADLWEQECEKHGLEKIVFTTAGGNEHAIRLAQRCPERFVAYAHHDPGLPNAAQTLEEAITKGGLRGYKILGPAIATPLNSRALYPVWEVAQARGIPVLIHFGILGSAGGIASHPNINPLIIHDVAKAFPRIPFIVPHFGCGYIYETLNLCWACPNVSIDTSGSNQWMRWMPYEVNLEILFRKYRETIGPERIIFGTDSNTFPRGFAKRYLEDQIRAMIYVGFSEAEVDRVLYLNAKTLLGEEAL
ncbi:MAG TPA: amidohydrolase family protein [Thermotogota bacterium]|nr:amidohydrolase family protein [Thermotogota bacterium]